MQSVNYQPMDTLKGAAPGERFNTAIWLSTSKQALYTQSTQGFTFPQLAKS